MLRVSLETLRVLKDCGCKSAHSALMFLGGHMEADTECHYNEKEDTFTARVPSDARKRSRTIVGMPIVSVG